MKDWDLQELENLVKDMIQTRYLVACSVHHILWPFLPFPIFFSSVSILAHPKKGNSKLLSKNRGLKLLIKSSFRKESKESPKNGGCLNEPTNQKFEVLECRLSSASAVEGEEVEKSCAQRCVFTEALVPKLFYGCRFSDVGSHQRMGRRWA